MKMTIFITGKLYMHTQSEPLTLQDVLRQAASHPEHRQTFKAFAKSLEENASLDRETTLQHKWRTLTSLCETIGNQRGKEEILEQWQGIFDNMVREGAQAAERMLDFLEREPRAS
jgi:hypothetical protein